MRDSLLTKRNSNFRVLCPNRMLGIFPLLTNEAAIDIGGMWGGDPVHPSEDAYRSIARAIEDDLSNFEAKYTNTLKSNTEPPHKKPRIDLAASRQDWVSGCSAILPRRDTISRGGGIPPEAPHQGATMLGTLFDPCRLADLTYTSND